MKSFATYKEEALEALKENWWNAVLTMLTLVFLGLGQSAFLRPQDNGSPILLSFVGMIIVSLILIPWQAGIANGLKRLLVNNDRKIFNSSLTFAVKHYWKFILVNIIVCTLVILGMCLFIIPGIILALGLSMVNYVIADNPGISIDDVFSESWRLMKGHKWELFLFYLSFIGWILLSVLTFGIGLLWLTPYILTATAAFYEDLKATAIENN
ncbi:MAG: DUF975 family protein [Candidatus Cryptobacteroides sp.]